MKRFHCSAVLFDLDGVLVDSTAYVESQWRRWAMAKGLSPEPFLRVCHGRRALETIKLAAPDLDAAAEVAAFVPDKDSGEELLQPITGAAQLLQVLPPGSWAVATSGNRSAATDRLHRAGLPIPAVLVGAEDVRYGKPSPDVYLLAADRLGISPAECVVVEDAPPGIQAARAAGMRVVALTTTHQLEDLAADAFTTSLAGIHLGRLERPKDGPAKLELLVTAPG